MNNIPNINNKLKSFARRVGKSISERKKNLFELNSSKFLINENNFQDLLSTNRKIYLEIGIGMGDNLINNASNMPDCFFIGCEPFLNGIMNVIDMSISQNINNIYLLPDDADLLLEKIPNHSLNGIYILFPDPWIKNKQKKRRYFNSDRINLLKAKIAKNGFIFFATDIEDYFIEAKNLLIENQFQLRVESKNFEQIPNYKPTKYHQKALMENRIPKYIIAEK